MNKVWTKSLLTFLVTIGLVSGASQAKAEGIFEDLLADYDLEVGISADVAVYDKYIWRGFRLDGDKSIQPGVTVSVGPFEGGYWGSWDLQNDDALASDESDGWVGFAIDLGFIDESLEMVGVSGGHTWYAFPEGDTYSKEFYLGFSLDTLLAPSFTWYHDYEDESQGGADGDYYVFAFGHSFELEDTYGISLDLSQEIGLNDEAFIVGDGGWATSSVGFTIPLTENVSLSPMVAFTTPWGDLEDAADGAQEDEFWGGVSVSFSG